MSEPYELIRSRRSTVAICVDEAGRVSVRAPKRTAKRDIDRIVDEKRDWIARARQKQTGRAVTAHGYAEGEPFMYMGRAYPLKYGSFTGIADGSFVAAPPYRESAAEWFAAEAARILPEAAARQAAVMGIPMPQIKLSNAKTLWGSRAPNGVVRLNARLVMAPAEIQDYVALHELCHITEMNHSPRFWAAVEKHMPDWRARRKWLRDNGRRLTLE